MKKYFFAILFCGIAFFIYAEFSYNPAVSIVDVTKLSDNEFSITLKGGSERKISPQDRQDHFTKITARMDEEDFCDNEFEITEMSLKEYKRVGGLTGLIANRAIKNSRTVKYNIVCN